MFFFLIDGICDLGSISLRKYFLANFNAPLKSLFIAGLESSLSICLETSDRFLRTLGSSSLVWFVSIVGNGSIVYPKACIQSDSVIGKGVFLNTNCCVEHDSFINDFVHICNFNLNSLSN